MSHHCPLEIIKGRYIKIKIIFQISILLLVFTINIFSSPWSVSLSSGVIRTTQPDVEDLNKYTFFPEVQIERTLLKLDDDCNWISGSIYYLYWNDFVSEGTSLIMDHFTYNHHFSTIGTKIYLNTRIYNFTISIFGGISRNYIYSKYISGSSYSSYIGKDLYRKKNLYTYGVNITYPIFDRISIGLGGLSEYDTEVYFSVNPRYGLKLFLRYDL